MNNHTTLKHCFYFSILMITSSQSQIVLANEYQVKEFIKCTAERFSSYDPTTESNNIEFKVELGCAESASISGRKNIKPIEADVDKENVKKLVRYSKEYKSNPSTDNENILIKFINLISKNVSIK